MLIDVDGLEDKVKPQIKNTRTYLKKGKDTINSISIPSDFSYRSILNNIPQTIMDIDSNIADIQSWVDNAISNFTSAEISNSGIFDNVLSFSTSIFDNLAETMKNASNTKKSEDTVVSIFGLDINLTEMKDTAGDILNYTFSGEWISDAADLAVETGSNVMDKVDSFFSWASETGSNIMDGIDSFFSWASETGSNIVNDFTSFLSDKIDAGIDLLSDVGNFVGSKLSDAWDFAYKNIVTPAWDFLQATGASIANAFLGLLKGIGQFGEALFDFVVVIGSGAASIFTGIADGITYLGSLISGDTENWTSITGSMWDEVMPFVAEDHVGNAYKDFYANTIVGQWLDEHAIGIFKSDGIATNIFSGIGYVGGIVLLTIGTFRNWYCIYFGLNWICSSSRYG